jgi:hypothetical protein
VEEAPEGDSVDGESVGDDRDYDIADVLLFLLESGVSEAALYGWHDGWHFERIAEAFKYFKRRQVENQRDRTLAVALGASSLLSKKPLEKFLSETEKVTRLGKGQTEQSGQNMQSEINKLIGAFNGNI